MRSKLTPLFVTLALAASVSSAGARQRVVMATPAYDPRAAEYAYYGMTPADGGVFGYLDSVFSCRRTYAAAQPPVVATY